MTYLNNKENMKPEKKAPSAAELKRLKDLLIWAKENNIQLHEVDFGSIKLTLTDMEYVEEETEVELPKEHNMMETPDPKSFYDDLARRRGVKVNG